MADDRVTIDFETRSRADLLGVGTWNYSLHPSTEVMCLSWRYGEESGFWHMRHGYKIAKLGELMAKARGLRDRAKADDRRQHYQNLVDQYKADIRELDETAPPTRLFELIAEGVRVEAHNSFFERCIWQHVCVDRMGWPEIDDGLWMCSASKASMCALPRDLERATKEMCPEEEKDMEGRRVMLKLSKPAQPTKAEPEREWHEDPEDLRTLWSYCEQDTRSEEALSGSLPDLPDQEFDLWQMDQRMNVRGVYCDLELAAKAIEISSTISEQLEADLARTTHGQIAKATQRAKIKDWLQDETPDDLTVEGTGAPVLDKLMQDPRLHGTDAHTVIDLVRALNRTSIKKYQAMIDRADPLDGRLRDLMMYHGAGTGRWSGKGVQPHNFPRGFAKDMDALCRELLDFETEDLLLWYTPMEIMERLSWALRGALRAPDGRQLYVADYAAIEARVLVWLAGDETALEVFRAGKDIYKDMACSIYGIAYEAVESEHRRMGKQAILGLGYQMGAPKFWDTIAGYEPTWTAVDKGEEPFLCMEGNTILAALKKRAKVMGNEELENALKYGFKLSQSERKSLYSGIGDPHLRINAKYFLFVRDVVNVYRERYKLVRSMWNDQNGAAISAVKHPGERYECNKVVWWMDDNNFLRCTLPSGRDLFYRAPEIGKNKFGKEALYYMSVDAVTKQWRRTGTYGGKLVENITQAVARDLMAEAMLRVDRGDTYDLLASVHDELICEADEDAGDVTEFEELMAEVPHWALGCPVAAEGWRGLRYRKD